MNSDLLTLRLNDAIEEHAFSGVVSVCQNGQVLYERAAGYADRSNKIANTLSTRFGIASGTKCFTALAIGKLVEAQKLSFSTLLNECVSFDFPHYSPDITIRHLLTHTSGIPDYLDESDSFDPDVYTLSIPPYELRSPRDYVPLFPDRGMLFAPGERFAYSNGGYILLGIVIEEVTGMSYQDVVEQTIFRPIGMDRSGFFALNRLPAETAFGYIEEPDGWRTNIYNLPVVGASDGGAFTTVQDIATFWKAFWSGEIVAQSLVELYTQPYVKASSQAEGSYYGHGMWLDLHPHGDQEISLSGCDAGVSFESIVVPANGLQVTLFSNTTNGAWPIMKTIKTIIRG